VVFKIAEPTDGTFVAELDSIDQGANNVVVSSVTYNKPKVRMEVGMIGGVFEGKASSDGAKITGTWTQAGIPLPLTIKRADPIAVARYQKVKPHQETAPRNARRLERRWNEAGEKHPERQNPSTSVHKLVEFLNELADLGSAD
jgi:hypothetical protein